MSSFLFPFVFKGFGFTSSYLLLALDGVKSWIECCGFAIVLSSPLLRKYHSYIIAFCLISSFCLNPIEFNTPSNSPWAFIHYEQVGINHIQAFCPQLLLVAQGSLKFLISLLNG